MKLLPMPILHRPEPPVAPEPLAAAPLEPIRLFLRDHDLAGWVRPGEERLTDLLQHGDQLWFLPASAIGEEWMSIDPQEVLLVVPPPHISPPERRVRRQRHEAMVEVDRYRVSGTAHLMPGEEYNTYLRSTRQYLPLTDAMLVGDGEQSAFDVLIVNLKRVDSFRVL